MKHVGLSILSVVVLVAVLLQPAKAQSIQLQLAPHGSKLIENNYGFSLDATCTIQSGHEKNTIKLLVLEKTGAVNGKHLSKGESTSVHVNNQDAIEVHAEPGSKVNVLNLSDRAVQATCSV